MEQIDRPHQRLTAGAQLVICYSLQRAGLGEDVVDQRGVQLRFLSNHSLMGLFAVGWYGIRIFRCNPADAYAA